MTSEAGSTIVASTGWDEDSAAAWVARDTRVEELALPWTITCKIVSGGETAVTRVLDVASGPGGFLGTVLRQFPNASGVWFDFSETMRTEAQSNLSDLAGRVDYYLGDMVTLDTIPKSDTFELVTTSRATHHLSVHDLGRFYSEAYTHLSPGGWVANQDNLDPGGPWSSRLRAARVAMRPPRPVEPRQASDHPQVLNPPTMDDHLACMRAAGFEPGLVVWRSLTAALVMARKPLS